MLSVTASCIISALAAGALTICKASPVNFTDGTGTHAFGPDWVSGSSICGHDLYFALPDPGTEGYNYTIDHKQRLDAANNYTLVADTPMVFRPDQDNRYWITPHPDTHWLAFRAKREDKVLFATPWMSYQYDCTE